MNQTDILPNIHHPLLKDISTKLNCYSSRIIIVNPFEFCKINDCVNNVKKMINNTGSGSIQYGYSCITDGKIIEVEPHAVYNDGNNFIDITPSLYNNSFNVFLLTNNILKFPSPSICYPLILQYENECKKRNCINKLVCDWIISFDTSIKISKLEFLNRISNFIQTSYNPYELTDDEFIKQLISRKLIIIS